MFAQNEMWTARTEEDGSKICNMEIQSSYANEDVLSVSDFFWRTNQNRFQAGGLILEAECMDIVEQSREQGTVKTVSSISLVQKTTETWRKM